MRQQAEKRLERAQRNLERQIERVVKERLPDSLGGSKEWVDPFVGVRGRYSLTEKIYVGGRADVGGFGVSSDSVWQLYGGIGYRFTDNVFAEVGYRHLVTDYTSGGFIYDTEASGFLIGVGVQF